MPIATDLRKRTRIVLESDQDLPAGEQPAFIFRRLTGSETLDLAELVDGISEKDSPAEAIEKAFKAVTIGLVGLENVTDLDGNELKAGDDIKWQDVLTIPEMMELAYRNYQAQEIEAEDKKKLDLPSVLGTARKSAKRKKAARARKNAKTSRPKPNR